MWKHEGRNVMYYLFGLMSKPGSGQTPVIFYHEPVELVLNEEGLFNAVKPELSLYDLYLSGLKVENNDQWCTSQLTAPDVDTLIFYSIISEDKNKVGSYNQLAELILRLIKYELENEREE